MTNKLVILFLLLICVSFTGIAQTFAPGENLVTDGLPAIPDSLVRDANRYTEFRSATFSSWHPTEHRMLINTRFADVPQVHLVAMPGGARQQLTFFPDRIGGASFNPKDPGYFVFSKDIGGGEWFQLFRYDLMDGTVTLLTDGKSRNILGPWARKGDRLAYTSTRRNGKDLDLYVMNPLDASTDRMVAQLEGGGWAPLDWAPDDKTLLVAEEISANESYLWLIDATSGAKTLLTPKGGPDKIAYSGGIFSADGKGIYVTTDHDNEFQRLTYIDRANGKETYLTSNIPWDVEDFSLSENGKRIAYVTNEEGIGILHVADFKNNTTLLSRPLPKIPSGIISGIAWHNDNVTLGFSLNSARTTSDAYALDTKKNKLERWTYSETGGLNASQFSEPELIHWKTFDGKTLSGFLYRANPKFTGKRPVIVNIHGGPEGQSRPTFLGRNNYYLNELGISMVFPNVRGSTGYGKTFLAMDNGFKREDTYKDINALFDWINGNPDLDGGRIMVTGGSYGGHMTLAIATHYDSRIKCSLDVVGMSNLVTFLEHTEAYRRDLRRVEYGDERDSSMRKFLLSIAPINHVDQITKPMFIVQGKNDPRVPRSEAEQMVGTLKTHGTPVWFLMANDEGHGFAKKKNQDFQFYSTIAFMKQYLVGDKSGM